MAFMRMIPEGPEHTVGDFQCPACSQDSDDGPWPQQHADKVVKHCSGLVHREVRWGANSAGVSYRCDECGESI